MGYMGLSSWGESDMAADAMYSVGESIVKSLKSSLREKDGYGYNTSGPENVGMILEALFPANQNTAKLMQTFGDSVEFANLLESTRNKLEASIKDAEKSWNRKDGDGEKGEEWGYDYDNYKMHVNAYKRILKHVNKLIQYAGE